MGDMRGSEEETEQERGNELTRAGGHKSYYNRIRNGWEKASN
jgi:hypothetical protein